MTEEEIKEALVKAFQETVKLALDWEKYEADFMDFHYVQGNVRHLADLVFYLKEDNTYYVRFYEVKFYHNPASQRLSIIDYDDNPTVNC